MIIPGTQERLGLRNLTIISLLFAVYFIAGKFGLGLAFLHPSATPVWAPTGIAIASFVIWGLKIWPGILLGAFLVNLTTEGTILTSIGIAIGNTLEGLVGAYFVKQIGLNDVFRKPENIFRYFLTVGVVATSLSATVGVTSLLLGGFTTSTLYFDVWRTWWLGNIGGVLIIAPLILLWYSEEQSWTAWEFLEILVTLALLLITNILLFSGALPQVLNLVPIIFFLPVLIWVALRFGPREVSTCIFAIYAITVAGTLNHTGPFATSDPNESLLAIQLLIGVLFLSVMPLSAAVLQQKQTENSLRQRKERYKKLIETSPDAILVSDMEGVIQVVNQQTLKMYGLEKRSEIVGKSGFEFIASEDQEKTKAALETLLKKGRLDNVEYLSKRKNGSKFYSSANASLIYNEEGKPEEIIIVSHDVTKLKEIEKMKSEFVSVASHHLRTPLGSMRWSIEMLLNGDYGEIPRKMKEVVLDMYDSLIRLIRLVNDLLDVSRIEEGRFSDIPQKVDVVRLIKKVIKNSSFLIQKRNLKLRFKAPKRILPPILIGKEKLADVFENLLSNSVKYTKPGGYIDVRVEKPDNKFVISFKDTGIGIPKKDRKKIFSKFYRSSQTTGIDTEGTGLGLFIVKSYIEDWGGKVAFKSRLGKGSLFTVEIPEKPLSKIVILEDDQSKNSSDS